MIGIIGIFLLFISWLFDDVSTYILIGKGFGILEANPIYFLFGLPAFVLASIGMLIFTGVFWVIIHHRYRVAYLRKLKGWKHLDILSFFWCLVLVFIVFMKISAGWSNINMILDDFGEEQHEQHLLLAQEIQELKDNDPNGFKSKMINYYFDVTNKISYFKMIFIVMSAYLLFKVGYKVKPYGA